MTGSVRRPPHAAQVEAEERALASERRADDATAERDQLQARIDAQEQVLEIVRGQTDDCVEKVDAALGHRYHTPGVHYSVPHVAEKAAAEIAELEARVEELTAQFRSMRGIAVERGRRIDATLALHTEFRIYEPCGHDHEDGEAGTDFFAEVGNVCQDGYRYSICAFCCTDGSEQHEVCADYHMPEEKPNLCWPCQTRKALKGDQPAETRGGGAQGGEEPSENSRDGDQPGDAVVGAGHGTTTPANSPRPDHPDVWRENGRWCWRSLPGGEATEEQP